jgi:hypothetical protein
VPEPEPRELRDDPTLAGDVSMLRQINPKRAATCVDWSQLDDDGVPRLRGGAFQRASLGFAQQYGYPVRTLSLYVEAAVIDEYGTVAAWAEAVGRPGWGVVRLSAGVLRSEGDFLIERDDLNGWIGHAVAWAGGSSNRADGAVEVR